MGSTWGGTRWGRGTDPPGEITPTTLPAIADHVIDRRIGTGAYGEVWLAQSRTGVHRAVKVVHRARFRDARPYEQEFRGIKTFEPVSRTHDSLISVLHVGSNDSLGYFYYVMELADDVRLLARSLGGAESRRREVDPEPYVPASLSSLLRLEGRLPYPVCVQVGIAVASGLAHLHTQSPALIHRDVSPRNILFLEGKPKLGDPGTVIASHEAGSFVGTPGFIPPEGSGTPQADIYSAGKLLYVASTGLEASRFPELPADLRGTAAWAGIVELNEVVERACNPDPGARYRSAQEMIEALRVLQRGQSLREEGRLRRRERGLKLALTAVVLLLLGIGAIAWKSQRALKVQLDRGKSELDTSRRELVLARRLIETERRAALLRIEDEFDAGHGAKALAQLAAVLRQDPTNSTIATRLLSAMTERSFALPRGRPMRHSNEVYWAEYSPDGSRIVTASRDGTARIWNPASGQPLSEPLQHADEVRFATFSPDGKLVATASLDGTARLWDGTNGTPRLTPLQVAAGINRVRFSPDSRSLAAAARDGRVVIWDVATGAQQLEIRTAAGEASDVRFSPDGRRLVTAGTGLTNWIWNIEPGDAIPLPLEDSPLLETATFSPDGGTVVGASPAGYARLWDAGTGRSHGSVLWHRQRVRSIEFSPDGGRVVTASSDGTARVWDAATGAPLTPPLPHEDHVRLAMFSPDGLRIATASADFSARIWDAWNGKALTEPIHLGTKGRSAQFSPDGTALLTATAAGSVQVWDAADGAARWDGPLEPIGVTSTSVSTDGNSSLSPIQNGSLEARGLFRAGLPRGLIEHAERINAMDFSPDGRWVATGSEDGIAQIWSAATGERHGPRLVHPGAVLRAQFNPLSTHLLTACRDGLARIWDAQTGRESTAAMGHPRAMRHAEFSRDGHWVVTATDGGEARVWRAADGAPAAKPMPHPNDVLFAHFDPAADLVLTACKDFAIRVWHAGNGESRTEPLIHASEVALAEFSSDGKYIVAAAEDKRIYLWNVQTGQLVGPPQRHQEPITALAMHPSMAIVATATADNKVRLWNSASGSPLTESMSIPYHIAAIGFDVAGRSLQVFSGGPRSAFTIPLVRSSTPSWFADFAESLAGGQWSEHDLVTPPDEAKWEAISAEVKRSTAEDIFHQTVRWILQNRATRRISPDPNSRRTLTTYAREVLEGITPGTVSGILAMWPTNPTALAARGREFRSLPNPEPYHEGQAMLLYDRALEAGPDDARTLNAIVSQSEEDLVLAAHIDALRRPLAVMPLSINLWSARGCMLHFAAQHTQARSAFARALELLESGRHPGANRIAEPSLLIDRPNLLRLTGQNEAAQLAFRQQLPARDPRLSTNHIDLAPYLNSVLRRDWRDGRIEGGQVLRELESGYRQLDGVLYDIRGRIMLAPGGNGDAVRFYPGAALNIPIGAKSPRLHFLHGAEGYAEPGTPVARYVVHYADGRAIEIPVRYAREVLNWRATRDEPTSEASFKLAWRSAQLTGWNGRLFQMKWTNPRPQDPIDRIDFVSQLSSAAPFLVAISLTEP